MPITNLPVGSFNMFISNLRRFLVLVAAAAAITIPTVGKAQSYPPAWNATATYAIGDVVQENGNWYRAIKPVTTHNLDPAKIFTYWELNYVRGNTTLYVGAQETFATFLEAWNYALNAKISDAVYLHFYISSFHGNLTQSFTSSFSLDHQSGGRISIIGDNPANIVMNFDLGGMTIDGGHNLASITGVGFYGSQGGSVAIDASGGASINSLGNLMFNGFAAALLAESSGTLLNVGTLSATTISSALAEATSAGSISFSTELNFSGDGNFPISTLYANDGGIIKCSLCTLTNCRTGIFADRGGVIEATGCNVSQTVNGATAMNHGMIDVTQGMFSSNSGYDLTVSDGGGINAQGATYTSTSQGTTSDGSYIFTS
jgi:hypothetical protein